MRLSFVYKMQLSVIKNAEVQREKKGEEANEKHTHTHTYARTYLVTMLKAFELDLDSKW